MRTILLACLCSLCVIAPVVAQSDAAVHLVVRDGTDTPVAGLTLTIVADDGTTDTIQTDADGVGNLQALSGSFFRIVSARQATGTAVQIEATTLDEGLRLGLLPNQTRTVLLRLDSNLLFVDPETIFSGSDAPATSETTEAMAAGNPTRGGANLNDTLDRGEVSTAVQATDAPRPSRWLLFGVMTLILLIPVGVVGARAFVRARRQKRRRV